MTSTPDEPSSPEDPIDAVISAWLEAAEQGRAPDPEELISQYPEFAGELREFFADHARMLGLAEDFSPSARPLPETREIPIGEEPTLISASGSPIGGPDQMQTEPGTAPKPPPSGLGANVRYFGDYELLQEVARGGMGVVFKARQVNLNRLVALKMILAGQLASPQDVQRFYTEAEAAAQLDHPGIVPIFEVGQNDGQHFFSMGFIEGQSLAGRVAAGPLPPREAAQLVLEVAQAVHYAHEKGVIHRDLKPGNILLDKLGKPRVTDFGLAKLTESGSDLTGSGQILGTPSYMPPEQASGKIDQIGPPADVYSLGAILYCLLTGRPPFQAASPMDTLLQVLHQEPVPVRQLNPQVPLDLETITLKCLEKDISQRYTSAAKLAEELQRFLDGRPILARPVSSFERAWRWCGRNPIIAGLAAGIAVCLVVGIVVSSYFAVKESQRAVAESNAKQDAMTQKGIADTNAALAGKNAAIAERNAEEAQQHAAAAKAAAKEATEAKLHETEKRLEAERQTRQANATRLAMQARTQLNGAPQRSLLLAAEAVELTQRHGDGHLPVAEQALRDGLAMVGGWPLLKDEPDRGGYYRDPTDACFSPDGEMVVALGHGNQLRAWHVKDLPNGPPILDVRIPEMVSRQMAFDTTTNSVVVVGNSNRFEPAVAPGRPQECSSIVRVVRYFLDGDAAVPKSKRIELVVGRVVPGIQVAEIEHCQLGPGGRILAMRHGLLSARGALGPVRFFAVTDQELQPLGDAAIHDINFNFLCSFAPSGDWCTASAADGSLYVLHFRSGEVQVRQVIPPPGGVLPEPALFPSRVTGDPMPAIFDLANRAVWTQQFGVVKLWECQQSEPFLKSVALFPELCRVYAVSPDGRWVLGLEHRTHEIAVFRRAENNLTKAGKLGISAVPGPLAISGIYAVFASDSNALYTFAERQERSSDGLWGRGLEIHDLSGVEPLMHKRTLLGNEGQAQQLCVSSDGTALVSAGGTNVRFWHTGSEIHCHEPRVLWEVPGVGPDYRVIRFAQKAGKLFAVSRGRERAKSLRYWRIDDSQNTVIPARTMGFDAEMPGSVSGYPPYSEWDVSHDGHWLAAADKGRIVLWDLRDVTSEEEACSIPQTGVVLELLWSAGDRWLVAVTDDRRLTLYRRAGDRLLEEVDSTQIHGWNPSEKVYLSDDARWLSVGQVTDEGVVRACQYDLEADAPLRDSRAHSLRRMDSAELQFKTQGTQAVPISGVAFSRTGRWALQRNWPPDAIGSHSIYDLHPSARPAMSFLVKGTPESRDVLVFGPKDRQMAFLSAKAQIVVGNLDDLSNRSRLESLSVTGSSFLAGVFTPLDSPALFCFRNDRRGRIQLLRLGTSAALGTVVLPRSGGYYERTYNLIATEKLLFGTASESDGGSRLTAWRMDIADILAVAKQVAGRKLSPEEQREYQLDSAPAKERAGHAPEWSVELLETDEAKH